MQFVGQHKAEIDRELAGELTRRLAEVAVISPHLTPILQAMHELSVGGKRLRATLVFLGYQLAGGADSQEITKAAMMMELFHLGLLIQDDFMDKDTLRRGVATVNARYDDPHIGNSVAMLAGDYTFGWGIELLSKLALPPERVVAALAVWGKYFSRVGYGQTLDGLDIADENTILQVLSIKSGEYSCILPLVLGATLGGGSPELLKRLEQYGMELGQVFQLRDDWLGMYGDSRKTGKPAGEQEQKGKKTFATLYGREKTEAAIAEHLAVGMELAAGDELMEGLLSWVATREN
jgi:geranylgeranyl diphosphate synthase, type I